MALFCPEDAMSSTQYCGLDFGTTNSTVCLWQSGTARLVDFYPQEPRTPSTIFFDADTKGVCFGKDAILRYLDGVPGRIMWAPKNILGTPLMWEKTAIGKRLVPFQVILQRLVGHLKRVAETRAGCPLDKVVLGRPVHYSDVHSDLDEAAQEVMREIAAASGFKEIEFEFEPIAAALSYELHLQSEQLALVVDMGGGTSDFTLIRLSPEGVARADRERDILGKSGVHIAGTDFDRQLSLSCVMPELGLGSKYVSHDGKVLELPNSYYHDLATWHRINLLYSERTRADVVKLAATTQCRLRLERLVSVLDGALGHQIARAVEAAKIRLSDESSTVLDMDLPMSGRRKSELREEVSRRRMVEVNALSLSPGHRAALLEQLVALEREIDLARRASERVALQRRKESLRAELDHESVRDEHDTLQSWYAWEVEKHAEIDELEVSSRKLVVETTRPQFENAVSTLLERLRAAISETLTVAGVACERVDAVFLTGGSCLVPRVQEMIRSEFPQASFVLGDMFGSVGMGLAIAAHRRFR